MKKLLFLGAVVGFIFLLSPADNAQSAVGNQVAICHFTGHTGGPLNDFVTTGSGSGCVNSGGNVIIVGQKACEKGHGAGTLTNPPFAFRDCGADNIGLLDPDLLRGNP